MIFIQTIFLKISLDEGSGIGFVQFFPHIRSGLVYTVKKTPAVWAMLAVARALISRQINNYNKCSSSVSISMAFFFFPCNATAAPLIVRLSSSHDKLSIDRFLVIDRKFFDL